MSAKRTAVITGSTSGIGLGIATEFAKAGMNIVLNSFTDRPEDHQLASNLSDETGSDALYIKADMSKAEDCLSLIDQANEAFGSLDILVNNAGIQYVSPVEEFPTDQWDAIIAINLSSAFHTTRRALPVMRQKGWGRIINIASAHGLTASPYKSAYIASKHGIIGLTKTIGLETAEADITCNAICPGYAMTPIVEGQIPDQMKAHNLSREEVINNVMLVRQPSKQFVTTTQIGGTALFLASDYAAQITGTTISVDGGWTAL